MACVWFVFLPFFADYVSRFIAQFTIGTKKRELMQAGSELRKLR